ncbi:MAG: hypothetical protein CMC38_01705 [Flavobacteriaceae bacterium]|nr:hypothetical protein [Flavobacteriaceae bacterium]|tara:strand:- start:86 stop:508 length:423 start_codon:yes stop_codon:yes gene_type:complete
MSLKVIRYKNYGCIMCSEESKDPYDNKFFWSFFELSNGEIIDLNFTENLTNGKVTSIDYFFGYSKTELKTGEIREYKFGNAKPNTREFSNEFFDWFDANPPVKDCKELIWPTKDEEKCVKEFFDKNILKTKEVPTNIITL